MRSFTFTLTPERKRMLERCGLLPVVAAHAPAASSTNRRGTAAPAAHHFTADQKKALEKVGLSVEAFEAARKRVHKED